MAEKTLTGLTRFYMKWRYQNADDISAPADVVEYILERQFEESGSDPGQLEQMLRGRFELPANEQHAYDMSGGATDVFKDALSLGKVRQILVVNRGTESGQDLKIGQLSVPTGGNLMTDIFDGDSGARIKLHPGGMFYIDSPLIGYTVTGGSADVLLISNEGTDLVEYDLFVTGTT